MSQLKRITISFSGKDADLSEFFNGQQNSSLSIRLIIKKWIMKYGTGDVTDLLATTSSTSDPNNAPQNNHSINPALIDDDIDDDFDDL